MSIHDPPFPVSIQSQSNNCKVLLNQVSDQKVLFTTQIVLKNNKNTLGPGVYILKIASRTIVARGNNFLQGVASFR